MRECITGKPINGGYEIAAKDVLIVDEQVAPA
jgi:hypothetical protein